MNRLQIPAMFRIETPATPALSRKAIRLFRRALPAWHVYDRRIKMASYLTSEQREALSPLVRHWSVRYAAASWSKLRYVEYVVSVVVAGTCLFGPVFAVGVQAIKTLTVSELLLASMIYLCIFGLLSVTYFQWVGIGWLVRLGLLGTGISIAGACVIAAIGTSSWKAVQFGLVTALLAAAAIALSVFAGNVFGRYIWYPLRRRHLATLPPSSAAAFWLWSLADRVQDTMGGFRRASARRELLLWISLTAFWLEVRLPRAMWMAGFRGVAYSETLKRYRRVGSFVRGQGWRIIDSNDRRSLEIVRDDLARAAMAVARGDWTAVPEIQERNRRSRIFVIARRLVTPILLGGTALLLPHLPGVRLAGSASTSLQAALLLAAVLSLTPLDESSREQVLGLFKDPHHPSG